MRYTDKMQKDEERRYSAPPVQAERKRHMKHPELYKKLLAHILAFAMVISGISIAAPLATQDAYAGSERCLYAVREGETLRILYDANYDDENENHGLIGDEEADYGWYDWDNSDGEYSFEIVVIDDSVKDYHGLKDLSEWFSGFTSLLSVEGMTNLDTSSVTSMYGLFSDCSKLKELDLSGFDTAKVKSMETMFDCCSALKTIWVDSDKWTTSGLTLHRSDPDNEDIFDGCESLVGG